MVKKERTSNPLADVKKVPKIPRNYEPINIETSELRKLPAPEPRKRKVVPVAPAPVEETPPMEAAEDVPEEAATFKSIGLCREMVVACEKMNWEAPMPIQVAAVPPALKGKDIVAIAATGSGKTGAFVLPILQNLLRKPTRMRVLVLTPTRELCLQISEEFRKLGAEVGLEAATLIGGVDITTQALALAKKPHVIVGSPGRVADHLENTRGFSLRNVKYLVFDEADRLLAQEFDEGIKRILDVLPNDRQTYLFSATMTTNVAKLEKAALLDPQLVKVNSRHETAENLKAYFRLVPEAKKFAALLALLEELGRVPTILFCNTCDKVIQIQAFLKHAGIQAAALHGRLDQSERIQSLERFKKADCPALVATDVASRGLDIPKVDVVLNYDVPMRKDDYTHRVGRTARAGRGGRAITLVTQYDVENFTRIEQHSKKSIPQYDGLSDGHIAEKTDKALLCLREAESDIKRGEKNHRGKGSHHHQGGRGSGKPPRRP